ncbi:Two-component response regulator, ntrX-like [Candidatus Glomeribacter gigasporarum BEG34]|uniref:Two-component response regulator, ntrX-like n=2 Tax=Candidatus Glomeribacter gigasporarum TaxID=132144 RepID=G2J9Y8_9BURK|nr:Two-component response regulator, ntrX-like [Candidatus Glomeribacter gigasporarum BEG34]
MKDMATILVVDDEIGIRELLTEILHDEGHIVEIAANAREARDCRLRGAPDLVLLDIWMPDTDGMTLLKEWASQGQLTIPVIMMSGHATINTAVEATKIGALDFLEKPIALQKLLRAIEKGLAQGMRRPEAPSACPKPVSEVQRQAPSSEDAAEADSPIVRMQHISFDIPLRDARDAFERAYFEYHLARQNGSMTRIAEKAGLERTHLYRKLKHLRVGIHKNKNDDKPGRNRAE